MISFRSHSRQEIQVKALVLLALLSCVSPTILRAQSSRTSIVFFAEPQVQIDQGFWPALFQSLREDLASGSAALPEGALLDQQPVLLRGRDLYTGIEFPHIIQVRLLGRCDVLPQADRLEAAAMIPRYQRILFWTLLLASVVMAVVLIHEWIHIATQSASHRPHGITRASLSVEELIASPRNGPPPLGGK